MLILHPHGEDSGALASSMVWLVRLLRRDCWPEWGVRLEHSRLRRPKPAVAPQVTPQVNPQVDDVEFW